MNSEPRQLDLTNMMRMWNDDRQGLVALRERVSKRMKAIMKQKGSCPLRELIEPGDDPATIEVIAKSFCGRGTF